MTQDQRAYFIKNGNDDMNTIIRQLDRERTVDWNLMVWFAMKYPRFRVRGRPSCGGTDVPGAL